MIYSKYYNHETYTDQFKIKKVISNETLFIHPILSFL